MFLFQSKTLNFTKISVSTLWVGNVSPSLQDVTKTGQKDLDRELLDHWLTDPDDNTLQWTPALVVVSNSSNCFCSLETSPGADTSVSSEPTVLVCP